MSRTYERNDKGIIECYDNGEYVGVVVTTCGDPDLEMELYKENDRVKQLRDQGVKAKPRRW